MNIFRILLVLFIFSEHVYSQKRTVLVLSLDGVGFNYLQSQDLPSFNRLKKEGIRGKLKPVFQSTTFPAHASMATGVYPDRHGILHNIFFDRDKGKYSYSGDTNWFDVPPIWILAEQQSIKSALYYWIGSETDWRGTIPTLRKIPFNNKIDETKKINQIIDWLDLPQKERPGLIMSWWHGIDNVAHRYGPFSKEVKNKLSEQDLYLGRLLVELDKRNSWEYLTLIVVSDHGMTSVSNYIDLESILEEHGISSEVYEGPAVANIFLEEINIKKGKDILLANPFLSVYDKSDVPKDFHLFHPKRSGDLIITTEAPNMFVKKSKFNNLIKKFLGPKGMHGYHPQNEDMIAIFYAIGKGVRHQKEVLSINQVDLAPTIAEILDIKFPFVPDGKAINLE